MLDDLNDIRIREIITASDIESGDWDSDLDRLVNGDRSLTRRTAREASVKAIQRLLIFLGYSTSSGGSFSIDGDYGLGTNRAIAQFRYDHDLDPLPAQTLAYPCTWQTARKRITTIPEVALDLSTLEALIEAAKQALVNKQMINGDFAQALFNLNALDDRKFMNCRAINNKYGDLVAQAVDRIEDEKGIRIQPEWVLSIIRQETAGVIRPRFEQHYLSRLYKKRSSNQTLESLRYSSMSFGLGQIMGTNYKKVGAESPKAMFFSSLEEQVLFISRFLLSRKSVITKSSPDADDFRSLARYYNGPGYAKHHYDQSIANWFREFRRIRHG